MSVALPANHAAEAEVLSAILLRPERIADVAEKLMREAFDLPRHRTVFEAMVTAHRGGREVGLLSVARQLEVDGTLEAVGGKVFLGELAEVVATTAHLATNCELLLDAQRRRDLLSEAERIRARVLDGEACDDVRTAALRALENPSVCTGARLNLVRMSDVESQAVEWYWEPYIPFGKLAIIEGRPGLGKTWLTLGMTAAATRGWPLPGELGSDSQREPRTVLFFTCEDGLADTIRPRLDTAGADCTRVYCQDGVRDSNGKLRGFHLADVELLEQRLAELRPALVVIDPVQGFLGSKVDMHRANETRPLLSALGKLAEQYRCAVILIRHLRKSSVTHASDAGLGSIDFTAAARSVLLVGENPNDPGQRVVVQTKSSLAPTGEAFAFRLVDGALQWEGGSELTADDLLAPREAVRPRDEAEEWLSDQLADGPVSASTLREAAGGTGGFSWRTVERAKKSLGVVARKSGLQGGWVWELPPEGRQNPESGGLRSTQDPLDRRSGGLRDGTSGESVSASKFEQSGGLRGESTHSVDDVGTPPEQDASAPALKLEVFERRTGKKRRTWEAEPPPAPVPAEPEVIREPGEPPRGRERVVESRRGRL